MGRQKIKWLIRCRHGYKDELDGITDKNIQDLLKERNNMVLGILLNEFTKIACIGITADKIRAEGFVFTDLL